MDKIRNTKEYIDTVRKNSEFFKKYYFHSLIDLNLVKLDLILKYGILSKNLIQEKKLINLYTHSGCSFESKNGNNYISLTEYLDSCEFGTMFDSFEIHTLSSVSLLVDKSIETFSKGERETCFSDEVFCFGFIPVDNFHGIILPEHLSRLSISEVNCLPSDFSCYTRGYIDNWIACMESYFGQSISNNDISEISDSVEQLRTIFRKYENPEDYVKSAIKEQRKQYGKDIKDVLASVLQELWSEKLRIEDPKYMDVLLHINEERVPVYEIKQKGLKRIN